MPKMLQHASIALSDPEHGFSDDFLRHKLPHSCHKSYLLWPKSVIQSVDLDLLVKFIFEATRGSHWPNGWFSLTLLYIPVLTVLSRPPPPPAHTPYNPKILHSPSPSELLKKKPLFHPGGAILPATPLKSSRLFSPIVIYPTAPKHTPDQNHPNPYIELFLFHPQLLQTRVVPL